MNVAGQNLVSTRYAGAGVAMVTAATLAVAPMTASAAGITAPSLPPIVKDIGGAASALANWATASGVAFITDPLTGVIKLVQNQVGNVTVIGGALADGAQQIFSSISADLPKALEKAQALIATGKLGDAWQEIANTLTGPLLGALLNGMTPIMNQLGPQIGPLADAFQAALIPIIGLVLPPISTYVNFPALVLDGISAAGKALAAGDPFGALNALVGAAGKIGTFAVDAVFGEYGVAKGLVGLVPAILSGLAGSEWATKGPFATKDGTTVSFVAADPARAAGPAALPAFPGLPQLQQIGAIWQNTLTTVFTGLTGEYGLPSLIEVLTKNLPKGELAFSYTKIHGVIGAAVLGLGAGILETGTVLNPFLGPLGKGLENASGDLLRLTLGAYNYTKDLGAVPLAALEKVGKAVLAGDAFGALQALSAGIAATVGTAVNGIFAPGEMFSPGLLPALLDVTKSFIDGVTGKAPAAKSSDSVTAVASTDVLADTAKSEVAVSTGSSPVVDTPKAEVPSTGSPSTGTPAETPSTGSPSTGAPSAETPSVETPSTGTPSAETPTVEAPKTETPETPGTGSPSAGGDTDSGSSAGSDAGSESGSEAGSAVETAAAA